MLFVWDIFSIFPSKVPCPSADQTHPGRAIPEAAKSTIKSPSLEFEFNFQERSTPGILFT